MAKTKNRNKSNTAATGAAGNEVSHPDSALGSDSLLSVAPEADPERFGALEYFLVNAVFWLFCVVNFFVAKWFMGESTGLHFFFGVMAMGFSVACLISYLHDRFYEDDRPEPESP